MPKKRKLEAKSTPRLVPISEDVVKGIWVDGIGLGLSSDYVILEGIIAPPRSEKPYIAARLLFPPRLLEHLVKAFPEALKVQKKLKPPKVEAETKP